MQNRNKKRQRGKGRPRKKIYWREEKRKNEQKEKRKRDEEKKQENLQLVTAILTSQQNDIDEGRDNNVDDITVTTSSSSAGFGQQGEVDSLDLNTSDNENDNNNDWGGDGTDHHAQELHGETERDVADDTTQSLHLSLDRKMKLVDIIYRLVHNCTGMIGGNGHGAAMYGEMVQSSMQRVVEKLMSDTGLSTSSRFLDVGCGLGKPQLHVAQMAHVEFSYGIDIDELRVFLANLNLKRIMKEAMTTNFDINTRCLVMHGDIEVARVFDPFTHVYMFDVA